MGVAEISCIFISAIADSQDLKNESRPQSRPPPVPYRHSKFLLPQPINIQTPPASPHTPIACPRQRKMVHSWHTRSVQQAPSRNTPNPTVPVKRPASAVESDSDCDSADEWRPDTPRIRKRAGTGNGVRSAVSRSRTGSKDRSVGVVPEITVSRPVETTPSEILDYRRPYYSPYQ